MNNIKSIQTRYKGYHFRSRLEARWGVFFDALGLQWEYEPEGFEMPGGVRYLPDFKVYVTDTNGDKIIYWFEVKPENHDLTDSESEKINAFAQYKPSNSGAQTEFIVVDGLPDVKKTYKSLFDDAQSWNHVLWSPRRRPWSGTWEDQTAEEMIEEIGGLGYHNEKRGGSWLKDYHDACNAAKSARFEHGQSGA